MSGRPKRHLVDGREVSVGEMAKELGMRRQQLYSAMHNHRCGLQTVVNMIRDHRILHEPPRACMHLIDGRWMSVREIAEMLGVTPKTLHMYIAQHPRPDGSWLLVSEVVERYRSGQVRRGGSVARRHWVAGQQLTVAEAAAKLGVPVYILRGYMSRHHASLAQAYRWCEQRKMRRAEREILNILRGR